MDTQCINRLRLVHKALAAFEDSLVKAVGLNINETMALSMLAEKDNLLSGELAALLELTRSNMSKIIASLECKGLVERHACKDDSRCQRVSITADGRSRLDRVRCDDIAVPEILLDARS